MLVLAALGCTGCPPNVQQQAAFRHSTVDPVAVARPVGDLVRFEVKPPVAQGTSWVLNAHGLARFVGPDPSRLVWVAGPHAILMEGVVAPWDPTKEQAGRGWLTFGMQEGDSELLDVVLPVRPLPYREVSAVSYDSGFSLEPRTERLRIRRTPERVYVSFLTPVETGTAYAPLIGASLVETVGRRVLYAEVKTNFGEKGSEKIGHRITFSYPSTVPDPVEVVVVDWVGHGTYYEAFDLHRIEVSGGAVEPQPSPAAPSPAPPAKAPG